MKKYILSILLVGQGLILSAQDLQNFYQYTLDWTNINNAYVGTNRSLDWLVMTRTQFNSIPNSPKNIMGLIQMGISENQGVGLKMINDSRGVFNSTRVDATYSQRFDLDEQSYLRFGISFGALNSNIDLSKLSNGDIVSATNDPVPMSSDYNYTHFITGFGMVAGYKDFEFGVSAPHLVVSSMGLEPFLFTTASYRHQLPGSNFALIPSVVYQNRPDQDNVLDGFMNVSYKDFLKLITGYTTDNRLKLGVGVNYKNFGLSYLNDNPTGNNTIMATSANEIALKLKINQGKSKEVVDVRSEIQKLMDETVVLLTGDHDRSYLKKRLVEIEQQLDLLMSKNSKVTAKEVEKDISALESQLLLIIEKYNLTNE
jgi:type IX secretion system PorP/SprF family membrane protein